MGHVVWYISINFQHSSVEELCDGVMQGAIFFDPLLYVNQVLNVTADNCCFSLFFGRERELMSLWASYRDLGSNLACRGSTSRTS